MRVSSILFAIFAICAVATCLYVEFAHLWLAQAVAAGVDVPSAWVHELYMLRDARFIFVIGAIILGAYVAFQRKYALPSETKTRQIIESENHEAISDHGDVSS